jgi:predicted lipoprotein
MNVMTAAKRIVFALLVVAGLALVAVGANGPCPLPIDSSAAASESGSTQSPEKPKCMRIVMHNGMPICLPCPAADAHVRVHGDADLGPCDKPGNQDPGGH